MRVAIAVPVVPVSSPTSPREEGIWSDSFAATLEPPTNTREENDVVEQPIEEDKNRKVRRCLEPGDVILSVFNISRIVGLHASGS